MNQWGHSFPLPPPSRETRVRDQGDRETWRQPHSARKQAPPWNAGDVWGDFVLERRLGDGSSGFVYRALDRVSGRHSALKLLTVDDAKELVRVKLGFRRMMTLSHPSLLRVDRIHQVDGEIGLSMREIEGETFRSFVRRLPAMEACEAYERLVGLTRHYASALAFMHSRGYVHRDIKPANLMVDRSGSGVVIDYGLVGTFDPESDPNGARDYLVGTPMYVAPEVLWNQFHTPAGDIFSLGMVLLEAIQAVTGRPTVARSETSRSADIRALGDSIQGISESVPEILREACVDMLEFDPADRPTAMRISRLGLPPGSASIPSPRPQMVGRDAEMGAIGQWLDGIFAGGSGRLHITGPSGIGKTRLVDELVARARDKRWGQVFQARCQLREDQPMQAFGQLTDAIVARYGRGDREPLQVDPVSHSILTMAFPSLGSVVEADLSLPPAASRSGQLDSLEAASRLSEELRKVGPLVLVIDDVQWADRDTVNVLDRLQTAPGGMLGIVTVSRDGADRQSLAPDQTVSVQPLSVETSVALLTDAAIRNAACVSGETVEALARAAEGCPYRLVELAEEFRSGGAFSADGCGWSDEAGRGERGVETSPARELDRLWHRRMERLGEESRSVLRYIATAGRPVSIEQLAELSGLGDSVEAAISDLVQKRLVVDEATGGECVAIVHDTVTDRLIEMLEEWEKRSAHRQWARLLMRQDRPKELASRIAKHLIDAGEPGRAVSYAILAAEDAEQRFARTEAAIWHQRVIPYVGGQQQVDRVRQAARCFELANRPVEASRMYQRLAESTDDDDERFGCELRAVSLLLCSGRFAEVRHRLTMLAGRVAAPSPRSPWRSKLSMAQLAWRLWRKRSVLRRIAAGQSLPAAPQPRKHALTRTRRMELCLTLDRPMSMFDNLLAAEMNLTGTLDAIACGSDARRLYAALGQAVFGCYDRGPRRASGEQLLADLRDRIVATGDVKLTADYWSAVGNCHVCSCRWSAALTPLADAVGTYETLSEPHGFEIGHSRWAQLWSHFYLGQLRRMRELSARMMDDAFHRRDRLAEILAVAGLGGAVWLARDESPPRATVRPQTSSAGAQAAWEIIDVFGWIGQMQSLVYQGRWDAADAHHREHAYRLKRHPFRGIQLIRVHREIFAALLAVRRYVEGSGPGAGDGEAAEPLTRLRGERLPFATQAADLLEGVTRLRDRDAGRARELLGRAATSAGAAGVKPWQLAAEDGLSYLETGRWGFRLRQHLDDEGVVEPERFERLYTVRLTDGLPLA